MGCDGGTIPKRHELVKTAKRPEQKDKDMDRKAKWSTCTITQQNLSSPVVTCELGKLYNKESVLEFLLDRSICENASHIRNLKDVKTLKLTPNPGYDKKTSGTANEYYDTQTSKFVCPVVGIEMNGKYKFNALWTCGCAVSERAFKEIEGDTCHNCGVKFEKDDIVIVNAEGEDLEVMEERMKQRREKMRKLKKEKKDKKNGEKRKAGNTNGAEGGSEVNSTTVVVPAKKSKGNDKGKVLAEGADKGKNELDAAAKKKKKKEDEKIDVTKSKVYKSLFTSSEKKTDKNNQAHWITYNPYHL